MPIGIRRASRLIRAFGTRMQPCEGRPGDQVRLVRAVDADHAASGPVAEDRVGAGAERPRAVDPVRVLDLEPLADPEAARRRRRARRADTDRATARSAGRIGTAWRAGGRDRRPDGSGRASGRSSAAARTHPRCPFGRIGMRTFSHVCPYGPRHRRRTTYTSGSPSSVSSRTRAIVPRGRHRRCRRIGAARFAYAQCVDVTLVGHALAPGTRGSVAGASPGTGSTSGARRRAKAQRRTCCGLTP